MNAEEFKQRTQQFALRVIRVCEALPHYGAAKGPGRQWLRGGTSVDDNYRAACRARSRADSVAKMAMVEEECDESLYWLELPVKLGRLKQSAVAELTEEGSQILALVVASIRTARRGPQSAIG